MGSAYRGHAIWEGWSYRPSKTARKYERMAKDMPDVLPINIAFR